MNRRFLKTKAEAVRYLHSLEDSDLNWIVNVFQTKRNYPHRAKLLRTIAFLVENNFEVRSIAYKMPDEVLALDGEALTPDELVQAAEDYVGTMLKPYCCHRCKRLFDSADTYSKGNGFCPDCSSWADDEIRQEGIVEFWTNVVRAMDKTLYN